MLFPHYEQPTQINFGPTCLRMVAKYYGRNFKVQTLRRLSEISKEGISLLGILAYGCLLLLFCGMGFNTYAQNTRSPLFNLGDPAPSLKVKEWIKGEPVQNFEANKVYVVEFWATWCRPCTASMPHLSGLARKFKGEVTFIAIDVYEQKSTTIAKVKGIVDSLGDRMAFNVATEDTSVTVHDWLEAWGQKSEGIPRTFVINGQGKVAWIGYPDDLHKVLPQILNNTWNLTIARDTTIIQRAENNYLDSIDTEAGKKLSKYKGNYYMKDDLGQPDSALLIIEDIVNKEPRLKYAPLVAAFTFTALLKNNPIEALEYGKDAIKTPNYTGFPPYHSIIGGIKDYEYKLDIPAEIYRLGADAYSAEINESPYPELFNNPEVYKTIANWYWLAGDKPKAMKARRKAKKLAKNILYSTSRIAVSK